MANEDFEAVAVVPVESIMRSKPHESQIVLDNVIYFCLRHPLGRGESQESIVRGVDNGQPDRMKGCAYLYCGGKRSRFSCHTHANIRTAKQQQAKHSPRRPT